MAKLGILKPDDADAFWRLRLQALRCAPRAMILDGKGYDEHLLWLDLR